MSDHTEGARTTGAVPPARLAWPLVPRPEEDRAVAVVAHHGWNVALVGAPGLGKSVLAARVTDRVARLDRTGRVSVVAIAPGPHQTSMPFAAAADRFGDLPEEVVGDPFAAERTLREAARLADRDVVLRIDDADHLDAISARYAAWLVRNRGARLVLTCRDFTTLAEPLRDLWQDDLLERIDLAPLDFRQTESLLGLALGGPLESASVERVHRATQGNPLHLREVVRAAHASGALELTASGWYWRGRITASRSLADMYRTELARLPGDLRDVVDIVALADPIPLSRLLALVGEGDVDRVVSLGIVTVDVQAATDGTAVVRPSHPLIGEVLRELVPVARRTRLFARANAFRAEPGDGAPAAARLRAALWALECGVVPTTAQLLDAATVAVRLQEYESATLLSSAILSDERTGSGVAPQATVAALVLRAQATTFSVGREQARSDAERTWEIARTHPSEVGDALVVEAAEVVANIRQFHDDDVDAAVAITEDAMSLVGPTAGERLRILRLAHLGWGGRFEAVRAETDRCGVLGGTVPFGFLAIAPCAVIALAVAGRVPEAMRLARASLETAAAHLEDAPWSIGELMSVTHQVQIWAGEIETLPTQVTLSRSNPFFKYDFTLELIAAGNLAIAERRWEDAKAAFSAACERFAVMDHGGFAVYPWTRLALAHAMLGETVEAAAALERSLAIPPRGMRIVAEELTSTRVVTEYLLGRPTALEHAIEITERSEATGAWLPALFGHMMQLRILSDLGRDTSATIAKAREIAPRVQDRLSTTYQAYLDATERGDEAARHEWGTRMAALGFPVNSLHRMREALTKREHEVAVLAADGLSNRQIAERLGRSVRTVDAHMSRIFAKWDLHARTELADLV
jgi:DNA-binding CsgD family transcriptional regulator